MPFLRVFLPFVIAAVLLPLAARAATVSVVVPDDSGRQKQVSLYSASYALVIGVDSYQKGWPRLRNAVKDARAVAKALEGQGYKVTLVTDPGRDALVQAMREFFIVKGEDPDARLLMWFAGHGYTENGEGFIIPSDGAPPEAGSRFRLTALPMRDVSTFVRLAQSKHVFAIFDSCFSGTVFEQTRAAPSKVVESSLINPVRQFLTSGDAYQEVPDDGSFRDLFIRVLTGQESADLNKDGFVTGTEMGFYLSDRVTNLSGGKQTPRYGKLRDRDFDLGDVVLAVYRQGVQDGVRAAQPAPAPSAPAFDERALEMTFWQSAERANTATAYEQYLKQYPSGLFAGLAQERIRQVGQQGQQQSAAAAAAAAEEARKAAEAREMAFWQSTERANSVAAYEAYLGQYPAGTFAALASARVSTLNVEAKARAAAPQPAQPQQLAALAPPATGRPQGVTDGPWRFKLATSNRSTCIVNQVQQAIDAAPDTVTVSGGKFSYTVNVGRSGAQGYLKPSGALRLEGEMEDGELRLHGNMNSAANTMTYTLTPGGAKGFFRMAGQSCSITLDFELARP